VALAFYKYYEIESGIRGLKMWYWLVDDKGEIIPLGNYKGKTVLANQDKEMVDIIEQILRMSGTYKGLKIIKNEEPPTADGEISDRSGEVGD
jgi:hypothetical protein